MSRRIAISVFSLLLTLLTAAPALAWDEYKQGLAVPVEQEREFVTIRARRLAERLDLDFVRHDKGSAYQLYDWTVGDELYRAYQDPGAALGDGAYPFVITEVCLPIEFPSAGRITLAASISEAQIGKTRVQPGDITTCARAREIHIPHEGAYLICIPLDTPKTVNGPYFAGMFIQNPLTSKDSIALFLDDSPAPQTCFNNWGFPEVWVDMNDTSYCNLPGRLVLYSAGRPHGGVRPSVTVRTPRNTALFLCAPQTVRLPVKAWNEQRQPLPAMVVDGPGGIIDTHWEFAASRDTSFTVTVASYAGELADTADFHVAIRMNRPPWTSLPSDTTFHVTDNESIAWTLSIGDTDRNLFASYLLDGPGSLSGNQWRVLVNSATAGTHEVILRATDYCRCSTIDTVTVTIDRCQTTVATTTTVATDEIQQRNASQSRFDLDGDGNARITDLHQLVAFILFDSPPPAAGAKACDINGDGQLTVADISAYRRYLFPDRENPAW